MVGLHQILAGNVITCLEPLLNCQCYFKFWGCTVTLECYYMLGTTTKFSMPFQVLKEILFFSLGHTGLTSKKYIKHDLKNIKNVKVCKQGGDDKIVKVNLQSLIPASFSH